MSTVLFVCLHNAGRSQMRGALFDQAANGRYVDWDLPDPKADRSKRSAPHATRSRGAVADLLTELL